MITKVSLEKEEGAPSTRDVSAQIKLLDDEDAAKRAAAFEKLDNWAKTYDSVAQELAKTLAAAKDETPELRNRLNALCVKYAPVYVTFDNNGTIHLEQVVSDDNLKSIKVDGGITLKVKIKDGDPTDHVWVEPVVADEDKLPVGLDDVIIVPVLVGDSPLIVETSTTRTGENGEENGGEHLWLHVTVTSN